MSNIHHKNWWRNSNQRNIQVVDRKISWLELFFDLVYVIAISRTTHHLSLHLGTSGFLDYCYLIPLVYWGWLNGSWHHDILGANDVRTIFLTLWQMVILSALIVTLDNTVNNDYFNATIVILLMQLYISYLWWSEGIYDKNNTNIRQYYVIIYLIAFVLILSTFFIKQPYVRIVFYFSLILNFIPPFFVNSIIDNNMRHGFQLTASMTERMGLFMIILFGEVIVGVINGAHELKNLTVFDWVVFLLCIFIVFILWYIFFKLVGDKRVKKGYIRSNIYTLLFLPLAMSLGIIGVAFGKIFTHNTELIMNESTNMKLFLGIGISVFLSFTLFISTLVETDKIYIDVKPTVQKFLLGTIAAVSTLSILSQYLTLFNFLIILFVILLVLPIMILTLWNNLELKKSTESIHEN